MNSRPYSVWLSRMLAVGIVLSARPLSQPAKAEADAQQMASQAGMLGMMMMTMAGHDIMSSSRDCVCMGTGAGCPSPPAGACVFMALNIAAMAASIIPIFTSSKTKSALNGAGGLGFSLNPNLPLATQFGCTDLASCGCGGDDAKFNPACNADALKNLGSDLAAAKDLLEQGKLEIPEGKSKDDLLAATNGAMAALNSALAGEGGNGDDSIDAGGFGDTTGKSKKGGVGSGASGFASTGGVGGLSGLSDLFGLKRAGPEDRSALGKMAWNGWLDMVDDQTGKSLTIWQRATRRYQGENGARAFMMARTEAIRKQALKGTMPKIAQAGQPAPATKPAVKAAQPAPANRMPAAVGPATPLRRH